MTATPSTQLDATSASPAEQALLLRLLPATKTAPSPKVVMTTCNKLFRQPLSSEQWAATANELRTRRPHRKQGPEAYAGR